MSEAERHTSDLRSRLINGTLWNLVATVSSQGSTFLIGIIVARVLTLGTYGEYAIVLSTLLSVAAVVQFSVGQTATKYVAEFRSHGKDRAGRILGLSEKMSWRMGLFGAACLVATAPLIATKLLSAPHLSVPLMAGAGFLLFSVVNGYQLGALAGLESYSALAKASILSGLTAISGVTAGAWFFGLSGAVIGLSITAAVRYLFFRSWLISELKRIGIRLQHSRWREEARIITNFAIPAAAAGLFSVPAIWFASAILVRQPDGFQQMALYSAAFSIRTLVLFVPNVFNSVSLSVLNYLKGFGNEERYNQLFRTNVVGILTITTCVAAMVGLFGRQALSVYGGDFIRAAPVLWILLGATIPESVAMGLHQYLQSRERLWLALFAINVPRETLFVGLAAYLCPARGALGLAAAYVGAQMLALVVVIGLVIVIRRLVLREAIPSEAL